MIIAVVNNKGGVGKTTSVVHLAHALSRMGKNVMAVDLDSQASLCLHLFKKQVVRELKASQNGHALAPIFSEKTKVNILPLSFWQADVADYAEAMRQYADVHDIVLIDCPPSLEGRTLAALQIADFILIPTQAERLSVEGIDNLMQTLQDYPAQIAGIFVTYFNARHTSHPVWMEQLQCKYSRDMIDVFVPYTSVFSTASSNAKSGFEHWGNRKMNVALDAYIEIARVLCERIGLPLEEEVNNG